MHNVNHVVPESTTADMHCFGPRQCSVVYGTGAIISRVVVVSSVTYV